MDFHSLSRRELQALCKSKGIRANMSNAAMAEALQGLPSVDKTGEIGSKAPPPMSAMKEVTVIEEQTAAWKAAVAPEAEETIGEEKQHGCPLPRGGRARGKTRKAGAWKTEEVVEPALHTLPGNKRTVAEEAVTPVDVEEVAVGMRTRRSARSKVKIALDQEKEDSQAPTRKEQKADSSDAAIASAVVSDKSCGDSEEHAVVIVVEEEVIKPQECQNMTRRAVPYRTHEDVQQDQRMQEEVATVKKRTRRPTRSAAQKEQKAVGPEVDPKDDEVVPKVEEATKPQQCQNVTRRAVPCKTHQDLEQDQRTVEEVATTKKSTRRSTRSKVAAAARKGQKGPEADPKDDEVVPKVEEATKPQESKNVTRRATMYKKQEEVQPGQVTVAPEAMAAVEAEEVVTAKRRRRRSARSKVRVAARKGQKADSSDANGSTVSDDPKEEQVVEVVEEGPTKPNEEQRGQISNVRQFASLPKMEDSPILGVVSKPNAADASDKAAVADKEVIKEDDFTFTGEADLSNLLVNTLDRFGKPMYLSTDKEEKKDSECWWMLL